MCFILLHFIINSIIIFWINYNLLWMINDVLNILLYFYFYYTLYFVINPIKHLFCFMLQCCSKNLAQIKYLKTVYDALKCCLCRQLTRFWQKAYAYWTLRTCMLSNSSKPLPPGLVFPWLTWLIWECTLEPVKQRIFGTINGYTDRFGLNWVWCSSACAPVYIIFLNTNIQWPDKALVLCTGVNIVINCLNWPYLL